MTTDILVPFDDTIKYQLEPVGIMIRVFSNILLQPVDVHPFPIIHFVRIWHRLTVIMSNKDAI